MSHEAKCKSEISELPRQSSYSSSTGDKYARNTEGSFATSHPRLSDFLRRTRLQLVTLIFSSFTTWKTNTEHPKVAVYSHRGIAAVQNVFHLIPVGGAIALIVLQSSSYLIGYAPVDSTMLLFVAKLHELFMQASLMDVFLFIVRMQFMDSFIPLGMLSGLVRATQISYLWSLDYLSIFSSRSPGTWRRLALAAVIAVLVLLISLVGPSSAVLMLPRPGSSRTQKTLTLYAQNSTEELYPSIMDSSNGLDVDITSINLTVNTVFDKFTEDLGWLDRFPKKFEYSSYLSQDSSIGEHDPYRVNAIYDRLLRSSATAIWCHEYGRSGSFPAIQVNVTIPTWFSAASFMKIEQRAIPAADGTGTKYTQHSTGNGTATVTMGYPMINTLCFLDVGNEALPPHASYLLEGTSIASVVAPYHAVMEKASKSVDSYAGRQYYAPVWLPSPESGSSSLVGVFVSKDTTISANESLSTDPDAPFSILMLSCTITASWEVGEIQLKQNIHEKGGIGENVVTTKAYEKPTHDELRYIKLNVSDLESVQTGIFTRYLFNTDPRRNRGEYAESTENDRHAFALATAFALAVSKIPRVGGYSDPSHEFQMGGLSSSPPPEHDSNNSTTYKYILTDYGYGYGTRTTSIHLSLAVMYTYCTIVVAFFVYTIATGTSSTAWSNGIELVTLALQSSKPDVIGHASVGIESVSTFREDVGVRVNANDQLELVFARDCDFDARGLRKLQRNQEY